VQEVNWIALIIFILLFALITVLGFIAAHWRKGDLDLLHEWGLGGRRFGTIITWFLIGGDLYTAYTFIARLVRSLWRPRIAWPEVPANLSNDLSKDRSLSAERGQHRADCGP
jgi:solute:Na+ symporter, SSS family